MGQGPLVVLLKGSHQGLRPALEVWAYASKDWVGLYLHHTLSVQEGTLSVRCWGPQPRTLGKGSQETVCPEGRLMPPLLAPLGRQAGAAWGHTGIHWGAHAGPFSLCTAFRGRCLLLAATTDGRICVFRSPVQEMQSEWVQVGTPPCVVQWSAVAESALLTRQQPGLALLKVFQLALCLVRACKHLL